MRMADFDLSWKTKLVFVVTGVIIGLLVTTQFRSSIPTSSYLTDELEVQKQLIKSFMDDQALLKSKLVALRQKIDDQQQKLSASTKNTNLEILDGLKKELGLNQEKGPGVEINLNDGAAASKMKGEEVSQFLVNAADLRDVVNLLRTTKPEAIAINGQRVIASSPITSVGNTIMVNNFHLLPPFKITAIGDVDVMSQRLKDKVSLPDINKRVKENRISFSFKELDSLIAPVYNGDFVFKYIAEAAHQ